MKKLVNFRLDEELIEQMNKVAELENRSLTNMVETAMKNYCQTKLPPQAVKVRGAKKKTKNST